ncbi:ChpB-ChpS toxin-antitoxin system antitoxin [Acidovorax sp. sic0104]|uniref:ChpB-ChpS toxin-antitoxin system antitoxin n=1 Tax=Acidovorax sp. sic0104 TaxID=2854784 RepID=UPI001C485F97|nr:ChpB-ChpS toxin-antitoxin system antitoxin [Acidovorax sp. sic0104]MBV7543485.1 ChpB-ChpS toxin-antitoxin system antitoxin [Acidovorax sp. sic0104]
MDRANYLRVPKDFPMNAVVSATVGAQPNIGSGTALALLPSLIKAFGISSDQYLKLEAIVDGEILLTKSKYFLCDMIAQRDLKASPPVDLALWGVGRPEGEEIL